MEATLLLLLLLLLLFLLLPSLLLSSFFSSFALFLFSSSHDGFMLALGTYKAFSGLYYCESHFQNILSRNGGDYKQFSSGITPPIPPSSSSLAMCLSFSLSRSSGNLLQCLGGRCHRSGIFIPPSLCQVPSSLSPSRLLLPPPPPPPPPPLSSFLLSLSFFSSHRAVRRIQ